MINLKIDPEFQSQIPPLTDDEFKQLEENILKEGKLISPLFVWNNTLVDGHNRYAILQKHPEIYFSTMPLPFESREEVLAWICKNQLGRRNLAGAEAVTCMGSSTVWSIEKPGAENLSRNQHTAASQENRPGGMVITVAQFTTPRKRAPASGSQSGTTCQRMPPLPVRASHYARGVEIADTARARHAAESPVRRSAKSRDAECPPLAQSRVSSTVQQIVHEILHPAHWTRSGLRSRSTQTTLKSANPCACPTAANRRISALSCTGRVYEGLQILCATCDRNDEKLDEENAQKQSQLIYSDPENARRSPLRNAATC